MGVAARYEPMQHLRRSHSLSYSHPICYEAQFIPFKWRHYEAEVINARRPLVMPLSAQLAHLEETVLELELSAMKQIDCKGILDERKHGRRKNTT